MIMSPPTTAIAAALRWERVTPERGLGTSVRPPAFASVLAGRVFAIFTADRGGVLFAAGPDGVPAEVGRIPAMPTGLCAVGDRLVLAGVEERDGRSVVIELDSAGHVLRELDVPVEAAIHRHPQPACTDTGAVYVVWEERGPAASSTLAWGGLAEGTFGPIRRTHWQKRTDGFAATAGGSTPVLLRDSGYPPEARLHWLVDAGPGPGLSLPAPAVGSPVATSQTAAVLLLPDPQRLQLGRFDVSGRIVSPPATVLVVPPPMVIASALLIPAAPGVWAVAVASSGPEPDIDTAGGEVRREDFALTACDARSGAAGPPQRIGPPLAAAWLDGRLVLWTGRAGANVATWRLVR
jgi:hypothetical protein